jgi:hypothetical protein
MRFMVLVVSFAMITACSKAKDEASPPEESSPKPSASEKQTSPPAAAQPAESKPAPPPPPAGDPTKPTHPAPSKDAAIARLKEVLAALEAKDWDKVGGMFAFGDDKPSPEKLEKKLGRLIEIGEISAPGIELLAKSATWGPLVEVMGPEKAEGFARNFKVPVGDTYGFRLEQPDVTTATVGFHWDGTTLRLIRLNNVGKLK